MKIYIDIFTSFLKTGLLTFGGGPAGIALVQNEAVTKYSWFTIEEWTNVVAMSNSLPGPIATKLAAVVGYQAGGVIGAVLALIATVAPSAIAVIGLLSIYNKFKDADWMKGMMRGVAPVVVVMVLYSAYTMGLKLKFDMWSLGILLVSGVIMYFKVFDSFFLILAGLAIGALFIR